MFKYFDKVKKKYKIYAFFRYTPLLSYKILRIDGYQSIYNTTYNNLDYQYYMYDQFHKNLQNRLDMIKTQTNELTN